MRPAWMRAVGGARRRFGVTGYNGYVIDQRVLQLQHPDGQVFSFEPGSLALAFAVTGPPTDDPWFETLDAPADLARWLSERLGARGFRVTADDLATAKRLRRSIWHAAEATIDGRHLDTDVRETLNALAAAPALAPQITETGDRDWAPGLGLTAALSTIARQAIEVLTGSSSARLRRCEGVNCALLFVDTSRPGTRRWCSMERCGNRAKATAHRRRTGQEASH